MGDEAQKVGRRGRQGGSGIPALPLPKLATQADPLSLFPHCEMKEWCCLFILTGHVHKASCGDIQADYPALWRVPTLPLQLSSTFLSHHPSPAQLMANPWSSSCWRPLSPPSAFQTTVRGSILTVGLSHHIASFPSLYLSLSKTILLFHSFTCFISASSKENIRFLRADCVSCSIFTACLPATKTGKK